MRIKLNARERIIYLGIVGSFRHGDFKRHKQLAIARDLLVIKKEEEAKYGLRQENNRIMIDNIEAAKEEKEFTIPDPVHFSVCEYLKLRNTQGNALEEDMFLAQKLIPEEMKKIDEELKNEEAGKPTEAPKEINQG